MDGEMEVTVSLPAELLRDARHYGVDISKAACAGLRYATGEAACRKKLTDGATCTHEINCSELRAT